MLSLFEMCNNHFISTSLVASKSRVAPYKNKITILRLESLGNLILSRLILTVLNSFKGEIDILFLRGLVQKFLWPGLNRIIKNLIFVQNRVVEIRKNVPSETLNFCSTKLNPADLITCLEKNINLTKKFFVVERSSFDDCENKETFPETCIQDFESEI